MWSLAIIIFLLYPWIPQDKYRLCALNELFPLLLQKPFFRFANPGPSPRTGNQKPSHRQLNFIEFLYKYFGTGSENSQKKVFAAHGLGMDIALNPCFC
jgi:hypothetical protein